MSESQSRSNTEKSWGIGNLAHGAIMGDCVWRTRNPVHSVGHLPEGTAMETASHAEVPSRARWIIKGEGATRTPGAALPWLAGSARVPRKNVLQGITGAGAIPRSAPPTAVSAARSGPRRWLRGMRPLSAVLPVSQRFLISPLQELCLGVAQLAFDADAAELPFQSKGREAGVWPYSNYLSPVG